MAVEVMKKVENKGQWTHFWDMHSGGDQKLDWAHIFIEAPEAEAMQIFKDRFGRDPYNVTCDCCGSDYSVSENQSLEAVTKFHRRGEFNGKVFRKTSCGEELLTVEEYVQNPDVLVLYRPKD